MTVPGTLGSLWYTIVKKAKIVHAPPPFIALRVTVPAA